MRLLLSISAVTLLNACSYLNTDRPTVYSDVYFSHSEPVALANPLKGNGWSPTQWLNQSEQRQVTPPLQAIQGEGLRLLVYFPTDVDKLSAQEVEKLSVFFASIPEPQRIYFEVNGHTDSQHTAEYNQGLSERRAQGVAQWLRGHGVQARRIRVKGLGPNQPQSPNDTETGRAKNRRVEIHVVIRAPE